MTIKIEAGKYYRLRDGRKVGPVTSGINTLASEYWVAPSGCMVEARPAWFECGSYFPPDHPSRSEITMSRDIIAEWTDTPTVKEVGTLAEIGAKVGDVVECAGFEYTYYICHSHALGLYACRDKSGNIGNGWNSRYCGWRIVSRVSDVPTSSPSPVATETIIRKRIAPGTYGRVKITTAMYIHVNSMKTADEVTEAIATLTEIRDAMQENAQ